jgi:predicted metal-dependent enzyme (double-stranded beta helix superfamily)
MALTLVRDAPDVGILRSRQLLEELLDHPASWWHHVQALSSGRSYVKLLDLPEADAWLICWAPGAVLDLHDHGASSASFGVVEGRLTEIHRHRDGGPLHLRALDEGESVSFGPDHLHSVENRQIVTAASIHVYSPPLELMTFPDDDRVEDRGDWVAGVGPTGEALS